MNSSSRYAGLFGYSTRATIKNVVLDDSCSVVGSINPSTEIIEIGSVSGYCQLCLIESVVNMASVSFAGSTNSHLYVGGIVGRITFTSTIRNAVNYGSVAHSGYVGGGYCDLGGIAGSYQGNSIKYVQNCANFGAIKNNGTSINLYIGGIVGNSNSETVIENCVSGGRIVNSKQASGINYVGSVVGYIDSNAKTTITHCLWTNDVGYDNAYGHKETDSALITTGTFLKELTKETVDELNDYAKKNSTWNKWLLNTNNNIIHFKVNDYKGFNTSNKLIFLPDLAGTGSNTFKGWFTDWSYSTPLTSYEVSEEMTLYGLYGEVVAIVRFDGNGGTPSQQSKSVIVNKGYGALPEPERTGYTFVGWFTSKEEGKGEKVTEEDIVRIGSDHTLYAQWSINNYTITFIFNNGKENEVRTLNFNEAIVYPENLTREGHTFNGWSPKPDRMPAENVTVTANWTANNISEFVEIVFAKKDIKEEEIREIIKEYTQGNFTIEKIEYGETEGTRVIIKFVGVEAAQNFIDAIEAASRAKSNIVKLVYAHESDISLSASLCPFYLFGILF